MKFVLANGMVLAVPVAGREEGSPDEYGLVYPAQELPFYRVVAVSRGEVFWKVGDLVASSATGTRFKADGKDMYLFDRGKLAARKKA